MCGDICMCGDKLVVPTFPRQTQKNHKSKATVSYTARAALCVGGGGHTGRRGGEE